MTPLVKKILESGLVEKHAAALLERWGSLEPGSVDLVGKKKLTEENLQKFVEDIEGLVSPDVPMKETRLDNRGTSPIYVTAGDYKFPATVDEMGRLLVMASVVTARGLMNRGDEIEIQGLGVWIVENTEPIYIGDDLAQYQVTVHAR